MVTIIQIFEFQSGKYSGRGLGGNRLDQIRFTLTGDFAFLLPCFGLVKGCSGANPCLLCDQERSKVGGGKARWVETPEPSLRSFESLLTNYTGLVLEGEKPQAAKTKPWKSVTGPVLVHGVGDTPATVRRLSGLK